MLHCYINACLYCIRCRTNMFVCFVYNPLLQSAVYSVFCSGSIPDDILCKNWGKEAQNQCSKMYKMHKEAMVEY